MTGHGGPLLVGQLEFYGDVHLRPRLEGLGDEEYLWEPVEGCWSLRRDQNGVYALDGRWLCCRFLILVGWLRSLVAGQPLDEQQAQRKTGRGT